MLNNMASNLSLQIADGNILSYSYPCFKTDSLGSNLCQTPIYDRFVQFEVRYAIAEQSSNFAVLFKQGYCMSHAAQLLRGGQTRRPEPITATERPDSVWEDGE